MAKDYTGWLHGVSPEIQEAKRLARLARLQAIKGLAKYEYDPLPDPRFHPLQPTLPGTWPDITSRQEREYQRAVRVAEAFGRDIPKRPHIIGADQRFTDWDIEDGPPPSRRFNLESTVPAHGSAVNALDDVIATQDTQLIARGEFPLYRSVTSVRSGEFDVDRWLRSGDQNIEDVLGNILYGGKGKNVRRRQRLHRRIISGDRPDRPIFTPEEQDVLANWFRKVWPGVIPDADDVANHLEKDAGFGIPPRDIQASRFHSIQVELGNSPLGPYLQGAFEERAGRLGTEAQSAVTRLEQLKARRAELFAGPEADYNWGLINKLGSQIKDQTTNVRRLKSYYFEAAGDLNRLSPKSDLYAPELISGERDPWRPFYSKKQNALLKQQLYTQAEGFHGPSLTEEKQLANIAERDELRRRQGVRNMMFMDQLEGMGVMPDPTTGAMGRSMIMSAGRRTGQEVNVLGIVDTSDYELVNGIWQKRAPGTRAMLREGADLRPAPSPIGLLYKPVAGRDASKTTFFLRRPGEPEGLPNLKVFQYAADRTQFMQEVRDVQGTSYLNRSGISNVTERALESVNKTYSANIRQAVRSTNVAGIFKRVAEGPNVYKALLAPGDELTAANIASELLGSGLIKNAKLESGAWLADPYRKALHRALSGDDKLSGDVRAILSELLPGFEKVGESLDTNTQFAEFTRQIGTQAYKLGIAQSLRARNAQIQKAEAVIRAEDDRLKMVLSGFGVQEEHDQPNKTIRSFPSGSKHQPFEIENDPIERLIEDEYVMGEGRGLESKVRALELQRSRLEDPEEVVRGMLRRHHLRLQVWRTKAKLDQQLALGLNGDPEWLDFRRAEETKARRDLERWEKGLIGGKQPPHIIAQQRLFQQTAPMRLAEEIAAGRPRGPQLRDEIAALTPVQREVFNNLLAKPLDPMEERRRYVTRMYQHGVQPRLVEELSGQIAEARALEHFQAMEDVENIQYLRDIGDIDQLEWVMRSKATGLSRRVLHTDEINQEFYRDIASIHNLPPTMAHELTRAATGKGVSPFLGSNPEEVFARMMGLYGSDFDVGMPGFAENYRRLTGEGGRLAQLRLTNAEMMDQPLTQDFGRTVRNLEDNTPLRRMALTFRMPDEMDFQEKQQQFVAMHLEEMMERWRGDPTLRGLTALENGRLSPAARAQAMNEANLSLAVGHGAYERPMEFIWHQARTDTEAKEAEIIARMAELRPKYVGLAHQALLDQGVEAELAAAQAERMADDIMAPMLEFGGRPGHPLAPKMSPQGIGFFGEVEDIKQTEMTPLHELRNLELQTTFPNTVTRRRNAWNSAIAQHYQRWTASGNLPTPDMSEANVRGVSILDPRYFPEVGGMPVTSAQFEEHYRVALKRLDKALRAEQGVSTEGGEVPLSLQMVREIADSMQGGYENLGVPKAGRPLRMTEDERLAARRVLGFENFTGKQPNLLLSPLAMGNKIPGVQVDEDTELSKMFGRFLRHSTMTKAELIATGENLGYDMESLRGKSRERIAQAIFDSSNMTWDFRAESSLSQITRHIGAQTRALYSPEVQSILHDGRREALQDALANADRMAKGLPRRSARDIQRDVQAVIRRGMEVEHEQVPVNPASIAKAFSRGGNAAKLGAAGVLALAGMAVIRSRRQKPDHTADDMGGPPYQPGGSPYDNRGYSIPRGGQTPPSGTIYLPGVDYTIQASGQFDPNVFQDSVQSITGGNIRSNSFKTRNPGAISPDLDQLQRIYGG